MELSHLLSADFLDTLKTAAFIAACFFNRQAIAIISFHLVGEILYAELSSLPVYYFCASASLYAINAGVNIKLSYSIRQALLCVACLNLLAAADFVFTESETLFYLCYPWLINGLDVFILACLLDYGGRQVVGVNRPFHRSMVNL